MPRICISLVEPQPPYTPFRGVWFGLWGLMSAGLVMAFVTYILLSAFLSGIQGHFNPEDFSVTASYAFAVVLFEIVAIKFGCYLLSIGGQGQVLDLVAYGGYKFVGIVITILVRLAGMLGGREGDRKGWGRWVEWGVFIYCFLGLGFFMVFPRAFCD
jgi:protein transport protein YIF1